MKKIRIGFSDFWSGFNYLESDIYQILSEKYEVEISETPDYLFYGPYGIEHLNNLQSIRIFCTGENIEPDFNLCDYAYGFDWMTFGDRYFRRPNYYGRKKEMYLCQTKNVNQPIKTGFCSFVVSNGLKGLVDSRRDQMFKLLSQYKKVDSGGRHLNNIGLPQGVPDKLEFQKKYKFALAFENSSQSGYTTEKIVDAFAAGCIPIYCGDPDVGKVFNEKAFVNINCFGSLEEAIRKVIEIDNDDSLYQQMLREPALVSEEYTYDRVFEAFKEFLYHICDQDIEGARRRPNSLYSVSYEEQMHWLLETKSLYRISKKIHLETKKISGILTKG